MNKEIERMGRREEMKFFSSTGHDETHANTRDRHTLRTFSCKEKEEKKGANR